MSFEERDGGKWDVIFVFGLDVFYLFLTGAFMISSLDSSSLESSSLGSSSDEEESLGGWVCLARFLLIFCLSFGTFLEGSFF